MTGKPTGEPGVRWQDRYPELWQTELAALNATGWKFKVTQFAGSTSLIINYPLDDQPVLRLRVRYHETGPWFAPAVYDVDGVLKGARHTRPEDGLLCLGDSDHWAPGTSAAEFIRQQLPRLLAAQALTEPEEGDGLEDRLPEPVGLSISGRRGAVLAPDFPIPPHVDQGALVATFYSGDGAQDLGAGLIEHILGPGVDIETDLPARERTQFFIPIAGRWIRDRDYRRGETAHSAWRRVSKALKPLEVEANDSVMSSPTIIELIGLLVPDEITYRSHGESWVFLLRTHSRPSPGARRTARVDYLPTQYLSRALLAERTPATSTLAEKSVCLLGLGGVGMALGQDLVHSGLGQITAIDPDVVNVGTGSRQPAPLRLAGRSKVAVANDLFRDANPYSDILCVRGHVEQMWDDPDGAVYKAVRRAVAASSLVIDCTANMAVTRFIAQLRLQSGRPFLHVSATAGGWGGVVALLTPETGCWSCVEHARIDGMLPVPAADPTGWVTPTRCAEVTFTGARHQLHQVALHGSAVAINHLLGEPAMGNCFAASLRDPAGAPVPIQWTAAALPVTPSCLLHARADDAAPPIQGPPIQGPPIQGHISSCDDA